MVYNCLGLKGDSLKVLSDGNIYFIGSALVVVKKDDQEIMNFFAKLTERSALLDSNQTILATASLNGKLYHFEGINNKWSLAN